MATSIFKSEQAKASLVEWFDKFRARLPPTESRTVPTRFGDAHVLVGGPENAPAVVVLHGALASSAHALHELAPMLERFRVYAVDVVGQSAKSADARPSVTNDDYGHWLADVLDGLSLQKVNLIGISWGGFVSIRFAKVAPERIERLALLVPAGLVKSPMWKGFSKMGWPMTLFMMSPTEKRLRAFVRHLLTTTDDDWVPYLGTAFRSFNMSMKVPALVRPEELKGLKAPTLVLGADNDLSFPGDTVIARAKEVFPNLVDTELIADCNHCPPTTDTFRRWLSDRLGAFFQPN